MERTNSLSKGAEVATGEKLVSSPPSFSLPQLYALSNPIFSYSFYSLVIPITSE